MFDLAGEKIQEWKHMHIIVSQQKNYVRHSEFS